MEKNDKDEMFPDEDIKGAATISTVLKDEKPKKEEPKPKKEVVDKHTIYKDLENLWNVVAEGNRIGNMTRASKLYKKILSEYKIVILND